MESVATQGGVKWSQHATAPGRLGLGVSPSSGSVGSLPAGTQTLWFVQGSERGGQRKPPSDKTWILWPLTQVVKIVFYDIFWVASDTSGTQKFFLSGQGRRRERSWWEAPMRSTLTSWRFLRGCPDLRSPTARTSRRTPVARLAAQPPVTPKVLFGKAKVNVP